MFYISFAPLMNTIFDISTSNNIRISNIYAKNSRKCVGPQVNIYRLGYVRKPSQ